jgi:hypothetical protein
MKKRFLRIKLPLQAIVISFVAVLCVFCKNSGTEIPVDSFDVQFELPASVELNPGGEWHLTVKNGKAPLATDSFIMESQSGISHICAITGVSSEEFTVRLAQECVTGTYNISLKRDTRKKAYGKTYINIVEDIGFTPDEGTTVYGIVSSAGTGIAGVVVSDGDQVTTTNKEGIYQLKSAQARGNVFISIPGGYEVPSEGVLPQFHYKLRSAANVVERADFTLTKVAGQDNHKVFMLGDMHLANRTNDAKQFTQFTSDLSSYMSSNNGVKMYGITLGDMTWDIYWYDNKFYFPEYLNTVNTQLKGLQIFHTMGNHDNDYKAKNDFDAGTQYRNYIGPAYYSFNIGKVHYVVMDDIDCNGYDGTTSRNYVKNLSADQLDWLEKDLSYVDKSTPLVIAMHAQVFYPTSTNGVFKIDHDATNTQNLFNILKDRKVHFVTGHTHLIFNVTPEAAITGGQQFYEHNSGSVCASWWWSGNLTPDVHVSLDGSPGGYAIWDVTGTDFKWKYKATGWPEDYQFRSYDLNNVSFSLADVPKMPTSNTTIKNSFMRYVNAYPANSNNEVLINIWNWNASWTLSVVDENQNTLTATPVRAYDPLHIAALSVKRFNSSSISSVPNFITSEWGHFFKVKAADADVDLKITVKDEFGNTWTENMQRPKAFSTEAYKTK